MRRPAPRPGPPPGPRLSRRAALKGAATLAAAAGSLGLVATVGREPERPAAPAAEQLPDIQFDVGAYSAPPESSATGGPLLMPPVHTFYLTARLRRTPTVADGAELARALVTLEQAYPFGAAGLMTFVAYGLPYFRRFPAALVGEVMPRLQEVPERWVLEEATAAPTDVHPSNPGVRKLRFPVPVRIEDNDLLLTLRSDRPAVLQEVLRWLQGSGSLAGVPTASPELAGLLEFTSSRHQFTQRGLPRAVAEQSGLPYARFLSPESPLWMGFSDQQADAFGPPPVCTFAGTDSARLTSAVPGDYFDHGAIQHLSHVILDLLQFYDMADADTPPSVNGHFTQRVQYMFHAPAVHPGHADQLTDGGGPSFLPIEDRGPAYAERSARDQGRLGHLSTLQRVSRAADGTPLHLRIDGPGFDELEVPDGTRQPKLQFSMFVPTADLFARMRRRQASLDLVERYGVREQDNGLERFMTCTRRQNFLAPPRRHRSFPLVELL